MLAAPVFSIGLPTLVLLNMSDQMEARGGKLDTLALARELGHPVALISASHGNGLDVIPEFLLQADDTLAHKLAQCSCPFCKARQLAAPGPRRSPRAPTTSRRRPRCGRAVWTLCCYTA